MVGLSYHVLMSHMRWQNGMVTGLHLYSGHLEHSNCFTVHYKSAFPHSNTHSYTGGSGLQGATYSSEAVTTHILYALTHHCDDRVIAISLIFSLQHGEPHNFFPFVCEATVCCCFALFVFVFIIDIWVLFARFVQPTGLFICSLIFCIAFSTAMCNVVGRLGTHGEVPTSNEFDWEYTCTALFLLWGLICCTRGELW